MSYEMVVGLETHIELLTKTKIFCSCLAEFGAAPNTHCCPVCTGLPGTLPVLNESVVDFAVKAGLATNCKIENYSKMDRKNYVYPDLAKAYQISQFDKPICHSGYLTLSDGCKIRLNRIHIEEDAGKLIHEKQKTLIDYNRGGVALIEIVTEPDFRSSHQVTEYLESLRLIMKTIGISDCKMQEGSLRCDVNISVRKKGSTAFNTRTEIKNVNSFNFIAKAIDLEFDRQVNILEGGGKILAQTMRYDSTQNSLFVMRSKENSSDYRYFSEPDIGYIYVSEVRIKRLSAEIGELPSDKKTRYIKNFNISDTDASLIVKYPKLAEYFDDMVNFSGLSSAKLCANILLNFIFKLLPTEEAKEKALLSMSAEDVSVVIKKIYSGDILNNFTKNIIERMYTEGKRFDELFDESDFAPITFSEAEALINEVIKKNPDVANSYKSGNQKALDSLMGMAMKKARGRADAKVIQELILKKINI